MKCCGYDSSLFVIFVGEKRFYNFGNLVQCYKTFYGHDLRKSLISYSVCPDRPFQPSLMLVSKARAYLSEATFCVLHSRLCSWPYPKTLDYLGGSVRDKYSSLLRPFINYGRKKFYKLCTWLFFFHSRCQCWPTSG